MLTQKEQEHLDAYRNILRSLVMQNDGELLVEISDVRGALIWKPEMINDKLHIRLRVVIEDNVVPMEKKDK